MKKSEIKQCKSNVLIVEYVMNYAFLYHNSNTLDRGTKQLEKHCADLEEELLKRGILSEEDIERLNM